MSQTTCFLIDDDDDDRELFQVALAEVSTKFTFAYARNAIEALNIFRERKVVPGIIFLDENMPLMMGSECLLEIRKLSHLDAVPVYMYTTSATARAHTSYLAHGAQRVLIKPNRIEDLINMLEDLLKGF